MLLINFNTKRFCYRMIFKLFTKYGLWAQYIELEGDEASWFVRLLEAVKKYFIIIKEGYVGLTATIYFPFPTTRTCLIISKTLKKDTVFPIMVGYDRSRDKPIFHECVEAESSVSIDAVTQFMSALSIEPKTNVVTTCEGPLRQLRPSNRIKRSDTSIPEQQKYITTIANLLDNASEGDGHYIQTTRSYVLHHFAKHFLPSISTVTLLPLRKRYGFYRRKCNGIHFTVTI